jgi:8-oxo-dGTP diphosphatase
LDESTTPQASPTHAALAVVFQVREGELSVLLWQRARDPFSGAWSLPGGVLDPGESLEASILRHLATKVDVREVAHLGLVPLGIDPDVPADTHWHAVDALPTMAFDHGSIVIAGRERLHGKLSYSNVAFALAAEAFTLAELRDVYEAALGYEVSATNLKRVLLRRGAIEAVGGRRAHGPSGGRPAALFRFGARRLEVTDPFAVLRPPS